MHYEWDENKNNVNFKKHGIDFYVAIHVFDDPNCIEMYDFEHSDEEDRYIAIGSVEEVLFVVFVERKNAIRIISARIATERERRIYYEQYNY
ncbi:MAG: BrnT family toxin [Lachnospiraceae bacterium]|nr:BrnT family toxin [Lachnospiraceae bacterium]